MYNKVKSAMKSEGYTLLTPEEQFTSKSRLEYICPQGHHHSILNCSVFLHQKRRCPLCQKLKSMTPYSIIYNTLKDLGCEMVYPKEEEYVYFKIKTEHIIYTCPNGHEVKALWGNIKTKGMTCLECFKLRRRIPYEDIVSTFRDRDYDIISPKEKEYTAAYKQKIKYRCPEGHIHQIMYQDFLSGHGCPECAGLLKHKYKDVKKSFEERGYTLVSKEYNNNSSKLDFICPNGHEHSIRYGDWLHGHRCGMCDQSKISIQETELADFIESLGFVTQRNNRTIINPYELDIVIPEKKIAIEYCGLFWHTEQRGKDKKYHSNKLNLCNQNGYRLITIFEDEWVTKKDIVKFRLKHILGMPDETIYARKCKVLPISAKEASDFINQYHIQGYTPCSIKLGLYYDIYLVAVMTFAKGSISKGARDKEGVYELSRFCSSCKVIGGASKLLKHFQRNYDYTEIFSYADLRWSNGNLYKTIGFDHIHNSDPNYWYIDKPLTRTHRFNYRKNILEKKLETFDPELTEYQNMLNNGIDRVWDCGNMKFVLYK
jgi:hypothetical protein